MKTKLLYLMLFVTAIAGAQIVDIPDANFKAKLLAASTSLDIARNSTGQNIVIDTNGDGEIQESEAIQVYWLNVDSSQISDLTGINSFINITRFYCSNNYLTAINIHGLNGLTIISAGNNVIASIVLYDLPTLFTLEIGWNNLISLDLSNLPVISELMLANNPLLYDLNLKNGSGSTIYPTMSTEGPPIVTNLSYVCIDEEEVDEIHDYLERYYNLGNVLVTSYCSITPGGDYNTITGNVTFDFNGDGCDATDDTQSLIKVKIVNGTDTGYTFTNNEGQYTFYTQDGTFEVSPQFEDNQYFIASPQTATVNFPVVDNSIATENFCIMANGIHPDVEVVMVPIGSARPGFDANYKIVFKNKGNQTVSGTVSCLWDYGILEPVSITPMANDIQPGAYTWDYTDLQPFENREILMTLNVNSPTESPAVNSGDILPFTASITHAGTDETPQDNQYIFNQTVVNSFDPNNIICIEGDTEPTTQIGEYLHYVVNFENTGTAAADFVVIRHDIDPAEFDINTLEILNASHNVRATVTDNTIEFAFREINLQASFHGNILFKLKSRPNLHEGSTVGNQANIYFDYNHPIETNEANTVFATLSRGEFNVDASVKLYPNPATGIVNVGAKGNITSIQLYDVQGRLLQVANNTAKLDISSRAKGMYFVKVTTDNGVKVEKLIKQ
ncbi:T9SS type A sorting domain-containing protein [Flavobacterium sp. Sd200]|uniref:DUF7619 domain-containing protein n=1 Tax=Flavobacterium sp. Sd200 TaxID=2692211 RepID=UPI001369DA2B|nr:T9SS type A sorting domain-containing protein [Flavobacterium sp. Sd200]MXN90360.1 T9SS type A sorting domain-containing protein [Flavobacterium sp. Sd200]